jgi:DNA recombination protein RmuC
MQNDRLKNVEDKLNGILQLNEQKLDKVISTIADNLNKMQISNEQKLEKMRETVDEKLSTTLEKRFNESFKSIITTLDNVTAAAGEIKSSVDSVSDLKRVFTNVKTRGTWGEVQLGNVLEQMLSPNQYASQVSIDGSSERVDYVILLPGKNEGEEIFLPIDAKFPLEDYSRLCGASEAGDLKEVEAQAKNLERRIKDEAKKIKEKYIRLPKTTDFAVMYLPVEGLYAEVAKNLGLCELLQREHKVLVCGPNTITALLNSLQMGFKTLAIEKRSSEIWKMLGVFKQEFNKFVELLAKTQKKLDEASNTIESATKKSRTIQKKLKTVADVEVEETEMIEFDGDE